MNTLGIRKLNTAYRQKLSQRLSSKLNRLIPIESQSRLYLATHVWQVDAKTLAIRFTDYLSIGTSSSSAKAVKNLLHIQPYNELDMCEKTSPVSLNSCKWMGVYPQTYLEEKDSIANKNRGTRTWRQYTKGKILVP